MDVRCDKCQARYRIDDARVGPAGLTMRCGKCSNTFKVTRAAPTAADATATVPSQAPVPAAPKKPAAAKPAADAGAGATMMFAGPAKGAPAKPPDDGGAGATMVFGAAPQLPKVEPKKPAPPPDNESGATMVFGQSPVAKPPTMPAMPKPAAKPPPAAANDGAGATLMFSAAPRAATPAPAAKSPPVANDGAGATLMFSAAPGAGKPTPPPPAKPPPPPPAPVKAAPAPARAPQPEPEPAAPQTDPDNEAAEAADDAEPEQARAGEAVGDDDVDPAAMTGEDPNGASVQSEDSLPEEGGAANDGGMLAKGPPRGLLIGVGAGIAALLVALVALVAVKKMSAKPPPEAAVSALQQGAALADKDSVALFATALDTTKAALAAAPKSPFGEAHATEAEIEVAWADALSDLATIWTDKGTAAQNAGDDKKKVEADAKVTDFQTQAKAHLKAALEATQAGSKADPKSPDLSIALADYYRANHASSNMNKELKRAGTLNADPARIALVQGIALSSDEDTADKAVGKLKEALKAMPSSARAHFRLAQALLVQHKEPEATAELKETLKLSPTHERAKAQLEALAPPSPPAEATPSAAPAAAAAPAK